MQLQQQQARSVLLAHPICTAPWLTALLVLVLLRFLWALSTSSQLVAVGPGVCLRFFWWCEKFVGFCVWRHHVQVKPTPWCCSMRHGLQRVWKSIWSAW
jgi:hypothetical protein